MWSHQDRPRIRQGRRDRRWRRRGGPPGLESLELRSLLTAGALDPTFGVGGLVRTDFLEGTDEARGIYAQPDGKLIVVGYAAPGDDEGDSGPPADPGGGPGGGSGGGGTGGGGDESGPNPLANFGVARYGADGSLDPTFNGTGKVVTDVAALVGGEGLADGEDRAFGVAVQKDGKIVVVGYVSRGEITLPGGEVIADHDFAIVRYNVDGGLDASFGVGGVVVTDFGLSDEAQDVAIRADGKILVSGRTGTVGEGETSTADFALARYNADGSPDASFGAGGRVTTDIASGSKDEGKRMDLMADGRIVLVGMTESEETQGGPDFAAVRYRADGSLDPTFNGTGKVTTDFGSSADEGQDVVVQPDGKVVVVGHVGGPSDFGLVRYNVDGSLDRSFGSGGKVITDLTGSADFPFAVALQSDGKIVAAGRASSGSAFVFAAARYNVDGALDATFGDGGKVLTDFGTPVPDQGYAVAMQATPQGRARIVVAGVAASDFGLAAYSPIELPPPPGGGAIPVGGQQFVSETLAPPENGPSAAVVFYGAEHAGAFLAAWQTWADVGDGSGYGIRAKLINADGSFMDLNGNGRDDDAFAVNTTTAGNQVAPTVASDGAGRFIIAWQGEDLVHGGYDVYYRRGEITADGLRLVDAADVLVNSVTTGDQSAPSAAMDGGGDFVIAWQGDDFEDASLGLEVYARMGAFATGLDTAAAGPAEFRVNDAAAGDQSAPSAAMAPTAGGGFVVAWQGMPAATATASEEPDEEEEAGFVIFAKMYDRDGATIVPRGAAVGEFQVNAAGQHDQIAPSAAMNAAGTVRVAWQAEGQKGSGSDIFARRFEVAAGSAVRFLDQADLPVNAATRGPQRSPAVGLGASGEFFVAWQSNPEDGFSWGVYGRHFGADGSGSTPVLINDLIQSGPQTAPAVAAAATPEGRTFVVWLGPQVPPHGEEEVVEGEGGHQPSVHARAFEDAGATALGGEFLVSAYAALEEQPASVARDARGDVIVVWQSWEDLGDGSGFGVYARRFYADGAPKDAAPFLVASLTPGDQSAPAVAMNADGAFVIVWQAEDLVGGGYDVYYRRGTFEGGLGAAERPVDGADGGTAPAVGIDGAGGFVVAWQAPDASGSGIFMRRFSADARPAGGVQAVNHFTDLDQVEVTLAMNASGRLVVGWVSDHPAAIPGAVDTEKSVFVRRYDAGGSPLDAEEFIVHQYVADGQERPAIAVAADGGFVVVWQSINEERNVDGGGTSWGVYARQYDAHGVSPQGREFRVNETTDGPQRYPAVAVDADGDFVVSWQSIRQDGSSWGVLQRQYNAAGVALTGEELVDVEGSGPQILPQIARGDRGAYVIVWVGLGADHLEGVHFRLYDTINDPPVIVAPGVQPAVEDVAVVFSAAAGNAIAIRDPDAGTDPIRVSLAATRGTLTLASVRGLTFVVGDGREDASLTFEGRPADVDAALDGLRFIPEADRFGAAAVRVAVDDLGHNGLGGEKTAAATINLTIAAAADAPVLNVVAATGLEGRPIPLAIDAAADDPTGTEILTIDLAGLPGGARLSAGVDLGGGSWRLTPGQLAGLSVTMPDGGSYTLLATATSTAPSSGDAARTVRPLRLDVANVAPALSSPGDQLAPVGRPAPIRLGAFEDVAGDGPWQVVVDWGDSTWEGRYQSTPTMLNVPTHAYARSGAYVVTVLVRDKDGGEARLQFRVAAGPAGVAQVVIGDGTVQRSRVNSLTVAFTGPVSVLPGAFTLRDQRGRSPSLDVATALVDGRTVATLTFRGRRVVAGSLWDGRYTLTIDGNLVVDAATWEAVDAAGIGVAGSRRTETFHRRYGDVNGDGAVNRADYLAARGSLGRRPAQVRRVSRLDFDGDGRITRDDLRQMLLLRRPR